jgi:hypothetical protein
MMSIGRSLMETSFISTRSVTCPELARPSPCGYAAGGLLARLWRFTIWRRRIESPDRERIDAPENNFGWKAIAPLVF